MSGKMFAIVLALVFGILMILFGIQYTGEGIENLRISLSRMGQCGLVLTVIAVLSLSSHLKIRIFP